MCGVVGIAGKSPVNQMLFDALTMLQHRGQDAAGIVTCHNGRLFLRKDNGMVRDVFHTRHMRALQGNYGIGHVRYPTAGSSSSAEAQPFYVNSPYGITLAHNGNLTNVEEIHEDLFKTDLRHMNTDSDSEVLLNVFAHELQKRGKLNPTPEDVFHVIGRVHERWSFNDGRRSTALTVSGNRVSDDADVVRRWAVAGQGLVYKSWLDVAGDVQAGRLDVVLEGWLGEPTPLNLICAHRDQLSGPVRLLREFLQQRCAELLVAAPWRAPSGTRPVSRGAAGSGRSP